MTQAPERTKTKTKKIKAAIVVKDLVKTYPGGVKALDGVSFVVEKGTVFGLLGPNGAGKTTAVRILTTTLKPDSGEARVLGKDSINDPNAVRERIGLAGQFAAVDENLTGSENMRLIGKLKHLPKSEWKWRSENLLERFDLVDVADRPLKTYSGGLRRRLDLAASMLGDPTVLFLDEPTTGLDPRSRNDLWEVIEELVASGTTVLLTTQYLEEADRLADRIAVIDQGRVIAQGTPASLKEKLGSTVLEIGLDDDEVAERAVEALSTKGSEPVRDGSTVEVAVDGGPDFLLTALRALSRRRITPVRIALREPSLDDVFLSLTGRKTTEEQGDE